MRLLICLPVALVASLAVPARASTPEVVVLSGFAEIKAWLVGEDWWGEGNRDQQLEAPNALITGISERWQDTSASLPVADKKEVFYRFLLPLILHANDMILTRRAVLETAAERLAAS